MKLAASILGLFLAFTASAWAQEQAFTNRATELKDRGANEARTLASLPENTSVKVIARAGAWTQVEANGQKGFVRVFHLRFPASVEKSSSSSGGFLSGVTGILGGGRQTQQASIATTGIRGLSPEDLKNAAPDANALAKAQSFRASKDAAERFARDGRLASVNVDEGGRR